MRPLWICSTYSMFEHTTHLTLIIINVKLLRSQLIPKVVYLFDLSLSVVTQGLMSRAAVTFVLTFYRRCLFLHMCMQPLPFFHEVFLWRDKSVVTSASPHT